MRTPAVAVRRFGGPAVWALVAISAVISNLCEAAARGSGTHGRAEPAPRAAAALRRDRDQGARDAHPVPPAARSRTCATRWRARAAAAPRDVARPALRGAARARPLEDHALARVFGVLSLSLVERHPVTALADIVGLGAAIFADAVRGRHFAVRARRVGRREGRQRRERCRAAARRALLPHSAGVDLDDPEVTVRLELGERATSFFTERVRGPGGLPLGVEGRAVALLSGGFDSAVAAWQIQKRGVECDYVFCNLGGPAHLREMLPRRAAPGAALVVRLAPAAPRDRLRAGRGAAARPHRAALLADPAQAPDAARGGSRGGGDRCGSDRDRRRGRAGLVADAAEPRSGLAGHPARRAAAAGGLRQVGDHGSARGDRHLRALEAGRRVLRAGADQAGHTGAASTPCSSRRRASPSDPLRGRRRRRSIFDLRRSSPRRRRRLARGRAGSRGRRADRPAPARAVPQRPPSGRAPPGLRERGRRVSELRPPAQLRAVLRVRPALRAARRADAPRRTARHHFRGGQRALLRGAASEPA